MGVGGGNLMGVCFEPNFLKGTFSMSCSFARCNVFVAKSIVLFGLGRYQEDVIYPDAKGSRPPEIMKARVN